MSIYVCSDIHGLYDLYEIMLNEIRLGETDRLYIIGDMIDRGPDGIRIMQDAAARDNVTCLIGNHEYMMWKYINRTMFWEERIWLHPGNGGRQTLSVYKKLSPDERESVKRFLSGLYLQIEVEVEDTTFLLSHSSFLADRGTIKWRDDAISEKEILDVVWFSPWRRYEYKPPKLYGVDGRYHVIGHVPVLRLDERNWPGNNRPAMPCLFHDPANRIVNIDLGCAMIPAIRGNFDRFGPEFAKQPALCVLDLERFARGEEQPAFYIGYDGAVRR